MARKGRADLIHSLIETEPGTWALITVDRKKSKKIKDLK